MSTSGRLTVAHYRTQAAIADATERTVAAMFRSVFDPKDIVGSWRRLEPLLVALVQQRHQVSAGVAANYVAAFRSSMGVAGRYVPVLDGLMAADDIVPWLRAAGPTTAFNLLDTGADVTAGTLTKVSGSVSRMILDGGRNTNLLNVERDTAAIGYARQARAGCCAFCAMLASRGTVYKDESIALRGGFRGPTVPEEQRYHHHCKCQAVPIYSRDQALPPNSEEFRRLWYKATPGYYGADKLYAFRRAFEGRDVLV